MGAGGIAMQHVRLQFACYAHRRAGREWVQGGRVIWTGLFVPITVVATSITSFGIHVGPPGPGEGPTVVSSHALLAYHRRKRDGKDMSSPVVGQWVGHLLMDALPVYTLFQRSANFVCQGAV